MSEKMQDKPYTFEDYRRIVDTLRSEEGCPWDRAQTKESLKPFMIEEMVEAVAAVNTNDMENLCEELGDQLLLILLQCSIARENGSFSLDDVIQKAAEKMIRRHPHVFPDENGEKHEADWDEIKRQEKAGKTPEQLRRAKEAVKEAALETVEYIQKHMLCG